MGIFGLSGIVHGGGATSSAEGWLAYDGSNDGSNTVIESTAQSVSNTQTADACLLDSTHVAVVYNLTSTGNIKLVIGSISGTAITWGTPINVETAGATKRGVSIATLSSSKLILSYRDSGGGATGQVAKTYTVSGTTPTLDATLTVNGTQLAATAPHFSIHAFSSTRVLALYWDGTNRRAVGLTVGSGTLTKDGTSIILVDNTGANSTDGTGGQTKARSYTISSTKMIVAYHYTSTPAQDIRIFNDSGSAVSYGSSASHDSFNTSRYCSALYPVEGQSGEYLTFGESAYRWSVSSDVVTRDISGSLVPSLIFGAAGKPRSDTGGIQTFPVLSTNLFASDGASPNGMPLIVVGVSINDNSPLGSFSLGGAFKEVIADYSAANNAGLHQHGAMLQIDEDTYFALFRDNNDYLNGRIVKI